MTTTRHPAFTNHGLDADVPRTGRAADAYEVAQTAVLLKGRFDAWEGPTRPGFPHHPARHAVTLHIISGRLHRLAERQCNEDLTCRQCGGDGDARVSRVAGKTGVPCRSCAGHGTTIGRRLERLQADARAIAEHYGLRVYFQTDPRGCSLYLIDPAVMPTTFLAKNGAPQPGGSLYRDAEDWLASNYNRGHTIARLGR